MITREPNIRAGFLKAIEEDRTYDFIANHYWEMSKEELKDILLEYIFVANRIDEEIIADILADNWEDVYI